MQTMKIAFHCPQCGQSTLKSVSELETARELACPFSGCGHRLDFRRKRWQLALSDAINAARPIKPGSDAHFVQFRDVPPLGHVL
jgi:hypothetical protein